MMMALRLHHEELRAVPHDGLGAEDHGLGVAGLPPPPHLRPSYR
jgi:hypothetical protein